MIETLLTALLPFLIAAESQNDRFAIGDDGKSIGILQIQPDVIEDVNTEYGTHFTLEDRKNVRLSKQICYMYLKMYVKKKGYKNVNVKTLVQIWNGGPDGPLKPSTEKHWKKVELEILKERSKLFL